MTPHHTSVFDHTVYFLSGANGWFAVKLPSIGWDGGRSESNEAESQEQGGLANVGGGLEISIKFAHQEDLEKVLHAGRGVGWSPMYDIDQRDWQSAGKILSVIFL